MHRADKTREQLLQELSQRRQREAELEATVIEQQQAIERLQADAARHRAAAEAALWESESRYRHLVENSQGLICIHDLDGVLLSVNPAAARCLGYQPHDGIGRNLREFLHPSIQHLFTAYLERMQRHGTDRGLMHVVTREGEVRTWLYHNVLVEEAAGTPYVLGHAQDITERVQIEKTLRESEARFRALVEHSLAGIYIYQKGRYRYVNPKFADIFGYTPEEILSTIADGQALIAESDLPMVRAYVRERLRDTASSLRYTFRGKRKDATLIDVEVYGTIAEFQGEPAIIGTLLDITDRRRLEEQLRQTQKMEAIGTLAGGIAHDFNNILAAIIGYTELATLDLRQTHPAWSNLHEVLTACRRAKSLVQQLLSFSRRTDQERQPVSLPVVIQEVLMLLRSTLPTSIEIKLDLSSEACMVLADTTQIHQVLMNLCINAEHAMRQTGGTLAISVAPIWVDEAMTSRYPGLQPGPYVRLSIRDSGHGMTPEIQSRIFEPFFTTKGVGEGSGMGLAVAHGMITRHGGIITVDSTPGAGSTFDIYLPRIEVASERSCRDSAVSTAPAS